MKTSEMIQSKFLKKEEFAQPATLTIKMVSLEEMQQNDTKWVMYFHERIKGLVLNVTKIKQLEAGFGDDTDMWIGKRVKLALDPTVMMGQQVIGGIKMILPNTGIAMPRAKPAPPPQPEPEFNDDLPPWPDDEPA